MTTTATNSRSFIKGIYVSSTLRKFIYFSQQPCELDAIITLIFVLRETEVQRDSELAALGFNSGGRVVHIRVRVFAEAEEEGLEQC